MTAVIIMSSYAISEYSITYCNDVIIYIYIYIYY